MTIDWQATAAAIDTLGATSTSVTIMARLLSAGRAYDSAGQPDTLHESAEHSKWSSLPPSQQLREPEPPFYVGEYYQRLFAFSQNSPLTKRTLSSEDLAVLPSTAREAYKFWLPKDPRIARRIATYFIAEAAEAKQLAAFARAPSLGLIETRLARVVAEAQALLEAS